MENRKLVKDIPEQDLIVPVRAEGRLARALDSDIFYSWRTSPVTVVATFVALSLILLAVFAPLIAPYNPFNPASLNLMDGFTPPASTGAFTDNYFLMGADNQGRDVLSTIMYGSRVSLFVGILATLFAMTLGVSLGLIAGYNGGTIDAVIMRVTDIQLSFPAILIALGCALKTKYAQKKM